MAFLRMIRKSIGIPLPLSNRTIRIAKECLLRKNEPKEMKFFAEITELL